MKLGFTIFIYALTICQPAIAGTAGEDVKPVLKDNINQRSATAAAESKPEAASAQSRGRMLYENHCLSCHESTVYIRARRKASNYNQLIYWVNQRADWLNLGWTGLEKREVIQYLNEYYKYPVNQ